MCVAKQGYDDAKQCNGHHYACTEMPEAPLVKVGIAYVGQVHTPVASQGRERYEQEGHRGDQEQCPVLSIGNDSILPLLD